MIWEMKGIQHDILNEYSMSPYFVVSFGILRYVVPDRGRHYSRLYS